MGYRDLGWIWGGFCDFFFSTLIMMMVGPVAGETAEEEEEEKEERYCCASLEYTQPCSRRPTEGERGGLEVRQWGVRRMWYRDVRQAGRQAGRAENFSNSQG